MKKVLFKDLEVTNDNGTVIIHGTIDNGKTSFTEQEIKEMVASILQIITNVGDSNGKPISKNVHINGNNIKGQQQTI